MQANLVKFSVRAYTKPSQVLMVVGNCPELGNWEVQHGVRLDKDGAKVNGLVSIFNAFCMMCLSVHGYL